ncbi:MAG: hypothetical protein M0Z60_02525 [Nitrospiraceae bacterium]|nr:hypothetical protein [Nitrospiraceae bacterium]
MAVAAEKGYTLSRKGEALVFSTGRFSAERESVLHKGIYNKDFASALSSLSIAGLVYVALALNYRKTILFHIVFAAIFIGGYPLFRTFAFKDRLLEALFDRTRGLAEISVTGLLGRHAESLPLSAVKNVLIEKRKVGVENPDAVEFVEKISAQHGQTIPGFGEEKTYYMLKLILADGSGRLIYSDTEMQDVIDAHEEIKEFLKI